MIIMANIGDRELLYEGYKGINLDKIDFSKFNNISQLERLLLKDISYILLNNYILDLETMSLDEAKNMAKNFFEDHFNVHNINQVDEDLLD